jgi:hypothetical protein
VNGFAGASIAILAAIAGCGPPVKVMQADAAVAPPVDAAAPPDAPVEVPDAYRMPDAPVVPRDVTVRPCPAGEACVGATVVMTTLAGESELAVTGADGTVRFAGVAGPRTFSWKAGERRIVSHVRVATASVVARTPPGPDVEAIPEAEGATLTGSVLEAADPALNQVEVHATRPDALGRALGSAVVQADGTYSMTLPWRARTQQPMALWLLERSRADEAPLRIGHALLPETPLPGTRVVADVEVSVGLEQGQYELGHVANPTVAVELRFQLDGTLSPFALQIRNDRLSFLWWRLQESPAFQAAKRLISVAIGARARPGIPEGGGSFGSVLTQGAGIIVHLDPLERPEIQVPAGPVTAPLAGLRISWLRGYSPSYQRVDVRCGEAFEWTFYVPGAGPGSRDLETFAPPPELGVPLPVPGTACTLAVTAVRVLGQNYDDLLAGDAVADGELAAPLTELVVDASSDPLPLTIAP